MTKENLLKKYPIGSRVKLKKMDDKNAPAIGTLGTVDFIDDILTIFVNWDNGSRLGVVYGEDEIERIGD